MVSTLTLVLVGLVVYTLGVLALKTRGVLPDAVRVSGPIVTLHTQRGKALLDRIASRRRFWRAWGNVGLGLALMVMALAAGFIFLSAVLVLSAPEQTQQVDPTRALVIPGVNDLLPVAAAPDIVLGLLLGLIVHEGGHGLLCRVENIDIDSMGVAMLAFIPVGAFVEPDERSRATADRGAQSRMFAAGVTNNFALTVLAFALLFGPIAGSLTTAAGVPVGGTFPGSTADAAALGEGDVVTAVNGTSVENATELERALDRTRSATVAVDLKNGESRTVQRRLLVTEAVPALFATDPTGTMVRSVNGTPVATERGFRTALDNRSVARLGTDDGNLTLPIGAAVGRVTEGGALAAEGAPTDRPLVITRVGDRRVHNGSVLSAVLADADPGRRTSVVTYVGGERRTYDVELGTDGDNATLGIAGVAGGTGGIAVNDFGVRPYPASAFLAILDGSSQTIQQWDNVFMQVFVHVALVIFFPLISTLTGGPFNFAGFLGGIPEFYTLGGPLSALGGAVFTLANICFWTGWVNLNLAVFNCIPAFPLDGGHMLRTSTEAIVSRLPLPNRRTLTSAVTTVATLTMLGALFLMFFGPQVLT